MSSSPVQTPLHPFFSVIIPSYNRDHLILATIESALSQNFPSYEIIVVDDGSTDDTEATVKKISDARVFYYKKINGERGAARNYGCQKAKGKYITFLDSDDLLYPHYLKNAFEQIEKLNFPFCYAQAYEIKDETGKIILEGYKSSKQTINSEIVKGNFLACSGVFIKPEVFEEIKFEEERMFAGTEDWLLWLQLSARYPFYFNNRVCAVLVQHDARSVHIYNEESLLFRPEFIKTYLQNDAMFLKKFGMRAVKKIYSHVLTYAALHLAKRKKKLAFSYLVKSFINYPGEIFDIRIFVVLKKIIFN